MRDAGRGRRWALRLGLAVAAAAAAGLFLEGLASAVLAWKEAHRTVGVLAGNRHHVFDPELGWDTRPGCREPDLFGPGIGYSSNSLGARGTRETPDRPATGRRRALALGDSFTLAHGVTDEEAWPARLEALCAGIESVNLGVSGHGVDQTWLRYRRLPRAFQHEVALLAVIRDDFYRMNTSWYTSYPRPRLTLEEGRLVAVNLPLSLPEGPRGLFWRALPKGTALGRLLKRRVPRLGHAEWKPDFTPGDERFAAVGEALLGALRAEAEERGARLVVAFLPDRYDLRYGEESAPFVAWLAGRARKYGVAFADLTPAFAALPEGERDAQFLPDGHYSRHGNETVARHVAALLGEALGCAGR